jgi:hypothetical protein
MLERIENCGKLRCWETRERHGGVGVVAGQLGGSTIDDDCVTTSGRPNERRLEEPSPMMLANTEPVHTQSEEKRGKVCTVCDNIQ